MIPEFVIKHFAYKQKISIEESNLRHSELEFFLDKVAKELVIVPTLSEDETWHNFILHTRLYSEYCLSRFGFFIHHNPKIPQYKVDCQCETNIDDDEKPKCDGLRDPEKLLARCDGGDGPSDPSEPTNDCDSSFTINTPLVTHER